jgi:hypothetical protein
MDFKKVYDRYSEKGWTLEQALGVESPPETVRFSGLEVTVFGITYPSLQKAADALGISKEGFRKRLASGASPEQAFERARKRSMPNKAAKA